MKYALERVLQSKHFDPSKLMEAIKTNSILKLYYLTRIRHYILEHHTLLVLQEFEKYFANVHIPMDRNSFRLFLALHDIGKAKSYLQHDIALQYSYSRNIINALKCQLPVSQSDIAIFLGLLTSDLLGDYLRSKTTANTTIRLIDEIEIPISRADFLRLLTIYYQVDAGSYTRDAGGLPYLEKIFSYENKNKKFDHENKLLRFSPAFQSRYEKLIGAINA